MNFSVNVSTIFTEFPFLERFKKAKEAGFQYVECQFPYDFEVEEIQEAIANEQLTLTLINLPPGNWAKGDRGLAVDYMRVEEFRQSVEKGITYATALGVKKIHCMAGVPIERDVARGAYVKNIQYAGEKLAEHGITLLIEPINPFDMPGYYLSNLHDSVQILKEIALPNVKLQYDFYHIQRMHGNLIANFEQYFDYIGHIQIADTPGRHEPGTGEIHFENIFSMIELSGYEGFVGLEYTPKGRSEDSFKWISHT
ncbi:hydroxypyruvate isomerase family protein [Robertmurraya kyonggiensis]|uniref:Hydroxypyruvate isomerase n=1 Tax=Robertmurraya kyonggiensis TaxID=1037680 RepID=A0A4U1DCZ6_9BACI|nr:TIM barrel protein [Robertmurraya kyonggiensis]TKC19316.1 hydroxypyruvate isomerase [Robertmurraya kyonggiensis]